MNYLFAGIFLILGSFVLSVSTFGIFRFKNAIDRIHASSKTDSLGSLLIILGIMFANGFNIESLKLLLIIVFLWITTPVTAHLVTLIEINTNNEILKECEVLEDEDI